MNKYFILLVIIIQGLVIHAQKENVQQLKLQLEQLSTEVSGLTENLDITVNQTSLSDFLRAMANAHKINLNISPDLAQFTITNNSSNAMVMDVLLFVCKEYGLTIDFTGTILSIKKKEEPKEVFTEKEIQAYYNSANDLLSLELQNDDLYKAFKKITDVSGKNLVFEPSLGATKLNGYIKDMPFDSALEKLAFANGLSVTRTKDNYYLFRKQTETAEVLFSNENQGRKQKPIRQRKNNFYFKVLDSMTPTIEVDFENTPISSVVYDITHDLNLDIYTSSPLDEAGTATFKSAAISLDDFFARLFENTSFDFNKTDQVYVFGKKEQTSLRNAVIIPLQYRSIEVMTGSSGTGRRSGRINSNNNYANSYNNYSNNPSGNLNSTNRDNFTGNRSTLNTNTIQTSFNQYDSKAEALINILPQDIIKDLEIKTDVELNSFIVSGPAGNIEKFRDFIEKIDKPIPVVSIEVMILEVIKSSTLDTGVSFGIGENPAKTKGNIFPNAELSLSSTTVNKILETINGYGSVNLGQVIPEFYANIRALESNGNIRIKSTPKLATLNGHRATISIGETTYYAVTDRSYYGSQIPQASEIKNYYPIDAELAIDLKPIVASDGQITMDISVIQSNFNGKKVDVDAPPGINSREFTSIVRVKDEEMVLLGGLEEKSMNDSGSGVPFLAKVPIIKWLFSKRVREDTKKKLVVLIKPTVIY